MERYLKSLKEKGLIEYRGSRKTGGYFKKIGTCVYEKYYFSICTNIRVRLL